MSICIVPDTPSPVFNRNRQVPSRDLADLINISSEDSFINSLNNDSRSPVFSRQVDSSFNFIHKSPTSPINRNINKDPSRSGFSEAVDGMKSFKNKVTSTKVEIGGSKCEKASSVSPTSAFKSSGLFRSPTSSSELKVRMKLVNKNTWTVDNGTEAGMTNDTNSKHIRKGVTNSQPEKSSNESSSLLNEATSLSLPGSPSFAMERAEALKKKKNKIKLSPFNTEKYDLSPLKNGINKLSAGELTMNRKEDSKWSPTFINSNKRNMEIASEHRASAFVNRDNDLRWSPSPIDSNKINQGKESILPNTGFVMSSALLASRQSSPVFNIQPIAKKRKVETASSQDLVVRPKQPRTDLDVRLKQPGTRPVYGWPSSSDSSDDEILRSLKTKKIKKKHAAKSERVAIAKRPKSPTFSNLELSSDSARSKKSVPSNSGANDYSSARHHSGSKNRSTKYGRPIVYNDIDSDYSVSDRLSSPVFDLLINRKTQSNNTSGIAPSVKSTPTSVTVPAATAISSSMQLSSSAVSTVQSLKGSPLGSRDNPIEVETMTPETRKALEEMQQLEKDEEIARKIQEEMDMEFAMALQNGDSTATSQSALDSSSLSQTGLHAVGLSNTGTGSDTPAQHWHIHSPARPRGRRIRDSGRRRDHSTTEEELLQLLRETYETINAGRANQALPFEQFWNDPTPPGSHRGRARRRGRGNLLWGGAMYSPGASGEDYENLMNLADMLGEVKDKGLTKTELNRLPVIKYKKTTVEVEECNICMTDYEEGDSQKILPCFHSYHSRCIDKWIQKNATCPICRVEVKIHSP